ncbi:MAG: S-layer homology domain-containing protein, partial [Ruminococcaceae bacterium]|nr:S-layer homology domain-containing protein [Oscillospiraceae bacterium]
MKKGLTLLLAFVMVITLQAGPVSAQTFADTTGTNCETEVDVLSALGIVEGKAEGAYEPDSALTRAEMATILLRAMNMAENAMGQDVFTDVPSSHWAYANIAAAYQMGIVNGTSATTFAPDASVTYEQAVKMVVAALGYTVQAEAMGGYPSGYLSKAAQLDVLRGVDVGGEMTRGNMAILLYNALDKPLFEKTSYGEDSYTYDANESATLLSRYLKVEKMTGKVVETPMACAELVPSKVLSDEVRVSDGTASTVMKKGDTDAQALLGVRADVFYREDDITDTPVIVAIVPRAASKSVEIVAKDVVGGNTTAQTLVYMEDGEEKEA